MKYTTIFVFLFLFNQNLLADTLDTPSFNVTINVLCEEGVVACDDVSYLGVSKKTGKSLALKGTTIHTECKDGSPCRFLGYEFKSGKTIYRVLEHGVIEVTRNGKLLVHEEGNWQW